MNPMVTANQKLIIEAQNIKRKKYKHDTKELIIPQGKRSREEGKEQRKSQNNQKKIKNMSIYTYLLITTLTVNGLNALFKRHRMTKVIKRRIKHGAPGWLN